MDSVILVLSMSVSGILVLAGMYFVMKSLLDIEEKRMRHQNLTENGKIMTPLRLTAYERLTLFLERIKPESMIIRIQTPTMNASELHAMFLSQVREEFEHNVSQQIYVSEDAWRFVVIAKESLLQFVNTCSTTVPQSVPAIELSKILIAGYNETEEDTPIDAAISVLKNEVNRLA